LAAGEPDERYQDWNTGERAAVVGGRVAHGGIVGGGICDPLAVADGIAVRVLITA
jgi:hypothetical protein